jgi:hypothetical protein
MIDVIGHAVKDNALSKKKESNLIFDHVDSSKHVQLANRKVSQQNKMLIITHLKQTILSSYLKDIYEDCMRYFNDLLHGAARKGIDPNRLLGEHTFEVSANDLLSCRTYDNILVMVSDRLFRNIENMRSTSKLLKAICNKLNIKIDQDIIDSALQYLEIRHILVHKDGLADTIFVKNHPQIRFTPKKEIKLDFFLIRDARKSILKLIGEFDKIAVHHKLIEEADLQP